MTTFIALLRAVNLAGRNSVSMAELRALATELGCENPRTLLQSGNLLFDASDTKSAKLEATLERAVKERLGVETDFFVRSGKEWQAIVRGNPFPEAAASDPGKLVLVCLKAKVASASVAALEQAIVGREIVRAKGREAYCVYPDGIGRSRLTMALIEKKLGTRGTGRNWNTVLKLALLAKG